MDKIKLTDNPPVVNRNADGSENVPIGEIEQTLDILYKRWGSTNHRFTIHKLFDNRYFASGTATLVTVTEDGDTELMEGSSTFEIFEQDENKSYESTNLSICIANAAKRKGIVFGRALNGRLEKGENYLGQPSVIQVKREEKIASMEETDRLIFEEAKKAVSNAKTEAQATLIAKSYGYIYNEEIKNIIKKIKTKENGKESNPGNGATTTRSITSGTRKK